MSKIGKIEKKTNTPYLNFYEMEAHFRGGHVAPYYVASRAKSVERLKAVSHRNDPDGVILYGVHGEKKDKVVLVRQFRYPIQRLLLELPAGKLDKEAEDQLEAAKRELSEETGLEAGELVHVIADCHIYDRHIPAVKAMLELEGYPAPKFTVDPSVTDTRKMVTRIECGGTYCRGKVVVDLREQPIEGQFVNHCLSVNDRKALNVLFAAFQ